MLAKTSTKTTHNLLKVNKGQSFIQVISDYTGTSKKIEYGGKS